MSGGAGAHVVYDSVGRDTWSASLDSLRPRGLMVSFGNSSGPVPPFAPLELSRRGSLYLTRPTLFDYIRRRTEFESTARELFDLIGRGTIRIEIGQNYALQDAAQAHRDLEAGRPWDPRFCCPDSAFVTVAFVGHRARGRRIATCDTGSGPGLVILRSMWLPGTGRAPASEPFGAMASVLLVLAPLALAARPSPLRPDAIAAATPSGRAAPRPTRSRPRAR